jgi:hypothetical protein
MDHCVDFGNSVYQGTYAENTWRLFHDGQKQWWNTDAQKERHHMGERQLKAKGDTNKGTIYANKVVGDSPEFCTSLDSYGFAHLENRINYNASKSSFLPQHDPRCMHLGTPA